MRRRKVEAVATTKRKRVESSSIKSIGYNKKTRTLEVEFTSGRICAYAEVRPKAYEKLMKAESIGSHFYYHVRDSYEWAYVDPPPACEPQDNLVALLKESIAKAKKGELGAGKHQSRHS